MSLESQLVSLAATARKLVDTGLVRGRSGNVSLRWQDQCHISPANASLDRLSAVDFIPLNLAGENTWQLQRIPDENVMHLACYRARQDASAVFHLHIPSCIALGCAGLPLKAVSADFYRAIGAEVPLLPFMAPSSPELIDAVEELIRDHDALLLGNHGLLLIAPTVEAALARSLVIEEAARIVLLAYAATGTCSYLTAEQMERLTAQAPHG